jgi:hypothetical protein
MKAFLIFIFFLSLGKVEMLGQKSIVKAYKKELRNRHLNPNAKYIKGYWKGLEIIIDSTKKYYGIDLNKEDTLFIVTSHLDFVIGGFNEARIWNNNVKLFSYNLSDPKRVKKNYKKVQKDNNLDDRNIPILNEIDEIKILIENYSDDLIFKNYMEKCHYLDGSIYELIWLTRKGNQFKIKALSGRLCVGIPQSNK